jgi:hypothetical protein
MEATENKQAESAKGLTFQELAQKNCQKSRLDCALDARVAEIVQANCSEHDPED